MEISYIMLNKHLVCVVMNIFDINDFDSRSFIIRCYNIDCSSSLNFKMVVMWTFEFYRLCHGMMILRIFCYDIQI